MSVFVIAEAGINHNGDVHTAKRLIDAARAAGADAVKFQMFSSERLWGDARIAHLELKERDYIDLATHASAAWIEFMCTPFGVPEVRFLDSLVRRWKIASGCLKRRELLVEISATEQPVILSTGMHYKAEVQRAIDVLGWSKPMTLLHCTSAYPCPLEAVNLAAMDDLRTIGFPVGYSDHTDGIVIPIAAAGRGAAVIEKHLTLDRKSAGPDHLSSIEPIDFKVMVQAIRDVERALGDGMKRPHEREIALRKAWGSADD